MNTKTATRVPSPEIVQQPEPQLPAVVELPRQNGAAPSAPPTVVMPQTGIARIATAVSSIMSEIGVVSKDGRNAFHNYDYAKMEDILQRLTPLMAKNGLVVFQTEIDRTMVDDDKAVAVRYAFTICHSSGEVWPDRPVQTGLSRCRDSKGGFDDKSFNKAHTAARKYFLLALFQIPTGDDDDADKGGNDGAAPKQTKSRVPSPSDTVAAQDAEPHAFTAKNAELWATKFLSYIAAAKSALEVVAWDEINRDNLTQLAKADPARCKTVMNAMKARKAEFEAGEPVTADGELPAKPKADGVPDAATEPDAFLKWADKTMAATKSLEALEAMFNGEIEPRCAGLFPPDRDELTGIFGKHERRFET